MPHHSHMQDRYGLPLTTNSTLAAEGFIEGIDLLLEQNFGPEDQFTQAIAADAGFALACPFRKSLPSLLSGQDWGLQPFSNNTQSYFI